MVLSFILLRNILQPSLLLRRCACKKRDKGQNRLLLTCPRCSRRLGPQSLKPFGSGKINFPQRVVRCLKGSCKPQCSRFVKPLCEIRISILFKKRVNRNFKPQRFRFQRNLKPQRQLRFNCNQQPQRKLRFNCNQQPQRQLRFNCNQQPQRKLRHFRFKHQNSHFKRQQPGSYSRSCNFQPQCQLRFNFNLQPQCQLRFNFNLQPQRKLRLRQFGCQPFGTVIIDLYPSQQHQHFKQPQRKHRHYFFQQPHRDSSFKHFTFDFDFNFDSFFKQPQREQLQLQFKQPQREQLKLQFKQPQCEQLKLLKQPQREQFKLLKQPQRKQLKLIGRPQRKQFKFISWP